MMPSWEKLMFVLLFTSSGFILTAANNRLLVLMLDGFRWDYLDHDYEWKGFSRFLDDGVKADYVNPIFPSLSYPSWTTLSTGLYAESHGIIGNYFYNQYRNEIFDLFDTNKTIKDTWWQKAEPVWTTATRQGKRVACIYWSRCDVPVRGIIPEYAMGYVVEKGLDAVRNHLFQGLEKLENDFDLVMVYAEHIDNLGHQYGPDSAKVQEGVRGVDGILDDFFSELDIKGLKDSVNVIIVADHGMTPGGIASNVQYLDLGKYVRESDVRYVLDRGAYLQIFAESGKEDKIYNSLKAMRGAHAMRKEEVPKNLHIRESKLLGDIIVIAEPGFIIRGIDSVTKQIPHDSPGLEWGGLHGYKPLFRDMRTIYLATGPNFKKNYDNPPIDLVDIYQTYCHVLDIAPLPNNGTWETVSGMFEEIPDDSKATGITLLVWLVFVTALIAVL